jgi:ubiquinone/menaquinone biosynthesis C-methylase UbiE
MSSKDGRDEKQAALWNGPAGRAWVDAQETLDRMFLPFEVLLANAVATSPARRVLDVGCGTGSTTLAVARRLGEYGRCSGIDISGPMLATARLRAEREGVPASFICGDAQRYPFEDESFDAIISRFGVMFFDDPIRAFANLRRAAAHGAALRFIAWRGAAENPFMTTAERAAAPLLPNLPAREADAPGQFAFANAERVRTILDHSGWSEIHIDRLDVECVLPERDLVLYLSRLGPVGAILQDADEATRAQVVDTVRAAFDPYVHGSEVRFDAACWIVGARAKSADSAESE